MLIWDETIFQSSSFNDPGLKDNNINYYFKNINMFDAWKKTTGNENIIIAIAILRKSVVNSTINTNTRF